MDEERKNPPEYCDNDGARRLKAKIEAYWRNRGFDVLITLQRVGFHPAIRSARFDTRSDMVNGMPTRRRVERPTYVPR